MTRKTNLIDGVEFETSQGRTTGFAAVTFDGLGKTRLCVITIRKVPDTSTRGRVERLHWFEVKVTKPNGEVVEGILKTLPSAKRWAAAQYNG